MKNDRKASSALLRTRAEVKLKELTAEKDAQPAKQSNLDFIPELEVHQIELQMQNEALQVSKAASEAARIKYAELYNFAPVGYFTISGDGEIIELNFIASQMLGKERSELIHSRLVFFISHDTKPLFNRFLDQVFKTHTRENCEVTFIGNGEGPIFVQLMGLIADPGQFCMVAAVDLTARKRGEEAWRKSELLLKSIVESQKDTMVLSIDTQYRYLYFNQAHSTAMKKGYNIAIQIGMNILECIPLAEDRILATENYNRALKGESHSNIQKYGDIQFIWFESFFNPIFNDRNEIVGATALARNITKRKELEEAIRISEERNRMLLELATDAFFQGNPKGDFIAVNSAAIEQSGFSKEELLQMNMKDLFSAHTLLEKPLQYEKLRGGEAVNSERELVRKDGTVIIVDMNSRMMPDGTFQSFLRDITGRKQIEMALKQKLGEMEIYYELAFTRERKMIALKSEINLLLNRLGEKPKY